MAEQVTIKCPSCGAPMLERINRANLSTFMGCQNWPACDHTEKVPAYLEVKRRGVELPGMETS